jgi:hypothetical protein
MVMVLFGGMCSLDPQYSAAIVREEKCTRLRYGTRLSRLHTLDPPLVLAFLRSSHSATPYKSQVPQAGSLMTGLQNSNQRQDKKKVLDHMRDKYTK